MQWFMYVRVLKIYLNDQNIVVRKSRTLEDCDRLMQSDNSSFDLSGDALVLGDWLLPALGEGRCWQFGVLTAREFGLLLSCHYSSVKKDSMENSVTKPFRFDLSQSQQFNLNSTKVQSFNLDLNFLCAHFSAKSELSQNLNGSVWTWRVDIRNFQSSSWIVTPGFLWCHGAICFLWDQSAVPVMQSGILNLLRSHNLSHCHLFGYCW